jgi:hypothetical protein
MSRRRRSGASRRSAGWLTDRALRELAGPDPPRRLDHYRVASTRGSRSSGRHTWVRFHTFRHTCATMLFRHGLNAKQVQSWLGHHSPHSRSPSTSTCSLTIFRMLTFSMTSHGAAAGQRKRARTAETPTWQTPPRASQTAFNPKVAGSIPARPMRPKKIREHPRNHEQRAREGAKTARVRQVPKSAAT